MKKLLAVLGLVCGLTALLSFGAAPTKVALPAACVVANGPVGLHLQAGYAPRGPEGCRRV